MRSKDECEIELQMNILLKFKYYGHYVMSRKFSLLIPVVDQSFF
ncbi:MAG: hypothetical protein ACYS8Y_03755 [Planctomycetota bacterium]